MATQVTCGYPLFVDGATYPMSAWRQFDGGTAVIDSMQGLIDGIDDLRRRCDAAGRDSSAIDVTFTNFDGGSPTDDAFNADAYLDGLEKLAKTFDYSRQLGNVDAIFKRVLGQ